MSTIVTRAGKGSPLTNTEVDNNFTNLNTDKVEKSGDTLTGDLAFGDNVKAKFGAGNDLQIYHDGSKSYISDQGTGNLKIIADNLVLTNAAETNTYFVGDGSTGGVNLKYGNATKFDTTSSGVDITGTVTVDTSAGTFTVDSEGGSSNLVASTGALVLKAGNFQTQINQSNNTAIARFMSGSGDVLFYNDGGTSQDFYWDASTSRLGLGTTSPDTELDVEGTVRATTGSEYTELKYYGVEFNRSLSYIRPDTDGTKDLYIGYNGVNKAWRDLVLDADRAIVFNANASEAMRIDSSGRLGIGTTSPLYNLDINDTNAVAIIRGTTATLMIAGDTENSGASEQDARLIFTSDAQTNASSVGHGFELALINDEPGSGLKFYNHNSNTEAMRIDSSGRLGIGTTSPARNLVVQTGGSGFISVVSSVSQDAGLLLGDTDSDSVCQLKYSNSSNALLIYTNGSEAMRIDSSGRLGIGTTSPFSDIHIAKSSPIIRMQDTDNDSYAMIMYNTASGGLLLRSDHNQATGTTGSNIIFQTDASEAARIDSSGNLLVGKTSASISTAGGEIRSSGIMAATVSNGTPLYLSRLSTDGEIVQLRKDGTTVGSIGTVFSDLCIGTGDTGIRFWDAGPGIFPVDPSNTFANKDNAVDLGLSSVRFKDLYLSGGVRADTLKFSSLSGSEYGRFDSSGNLLVGTTDSTPYSANGTVIGSGLVWTTRAGAEALLVNRTGSDGTIATFRKDGSTVGSIGVQNMPSGSTEDVLTISTNAGFEILNFIDANGDLVGQVCGGSSDLTIGTGDTGIRFNDGSNAIQPRNASTTTIRDAAIDLGQSAGRFKDLYLSGGVYLGGTGSANLLDDYEEGTFTPTFLGTTTSDFTYNNQEGYYVKIGNLVYVSGYLRLLNKNTSAGQVKISSLPFTSGAFMPSTSFEFGGTITYFDGLAQDISSATVVGDDNATSAYIYFVPAAGDDVPTVLQTTHFTNAFQIRFSFHYVAA